MGSSHRDRDRYREPDPEQEWEREWEREREREREYRRRNRHHSTQRHVHELIGSVRVAEEEEDCHNHRFCVVTGEEIPIGPNNDHIHDVVFRTDFYNEHFHEYRGKTLGMVKIGNRHVHYIQDETTFNDGHRHQFEAVTLIHNPIGKECKDKYIG